MKYIIVLYFFKYLPSNNILFGQSCKHLLKLNMGYLPILSDLIIYL